MRRMAMAAAALAALAACEETTGVAATEPQSGLPSPAITQCMAAVGERAGNLSVVALGATSVADGTRVTIGVGEARAPWSCTWRDGGVISDVARLPGGAA